MVNDASVQKCAGTRNQIIRFFSLVEIVRGRGAAHSFVTLVILEPVCSAFSFSTGISDPQRLSNTFS